MQEYLDIVAAECHLGGVVSFKTAWFDFQPLVRSGWCDEFLQGCRWVYLDRRDIDEQARSLVRARATGLWHQKVGQEMPLQDVELLPTEIEAAKAALRREKEGWREFFATRQIRPLELLYEEIVENVTAPVESVGRLVGQTLSRQYHWDDSAYRKL